MKRGTPEHPKMMALMEALGIGKATAVGLLELLWHFTARFAPRGDIGRFTDRAIASALSWEGDPGTLIDGLVSCGWLDRHPEHRLVVHDWSEHADSAVRMLLARRGLTFADGRPAGDGRRHRPTTTKEGEEQRDGGSKCNIVQSTVATSCDHSSHDVATQVRTTSDTECNLNSHDVATQVDTARILNPEARSQNPEAGSQKPVPTAAGARRAGNGTAGLPWLAAIETALADVVGRPPRPGTAVKLASAAASFGIHPRFVARWIVERNGSPPKSDGLFLSIVESDLVPWVRRQQYPSECQPTEQARCQRCGGVITAFRDAIVPCGCEPPTAPRDRPEPSASVLSFDNANEEAKP